ncbi:MAG: PDZ domain-containing protein [Planctomycetes bacterium]|nr:PDZ domain-containing protein [Planctomycetota bacterium]
MLRIENMRGIDLSIFDFDYDMQWFALMLTADGEVLGRFGGRDADTPGKYQSLPGLRHSLEAARARFKSMKSPGASIRKPMRAEEYPAAERLRANACIHCHHVYEFRRAALQEAGTWSLDEVWVYPEPANLGLTLDPERGNRVLAVQAGSPAGKLGIKAKDLLQRVDATPIASVADFQYALHQAPKKGQLLISWQSGTSESKAPVVLPDNWRKTDLSWRWSLKSMSPSPGIIGDDLDADGRKSLGLKPGELGYRHMNFLTPSGRHAGLQANDVIVGIDDKSLSMTARQFEAHIRLNYRVGQEITLNVMRGKDRVKLKLKLPE